MDRSLWLLLRLRVRAWARRWTRSVRTLKGLLLAVVGSLLFLPMIVSVLIVPRVQTAAQLAAVRRYGPLGLLVYCVLNVLMSSDDRTVYYSPAEVNFLFCGPYRPRQLLVYKVVSGTGAALLTSLFLMLAFSQHAARSVSAFAGVFLAMELLYLFSLSVGLAVSTAGALAFSRGRRLVLLGLVAVAVSALAAVGREAAALPVSEVVGRAIRSPVVTAATAPFRPFVMAFTAERVWPDLAGWSALAALIDLGLLALVLTLNARFLEASASASATIYARLQKARRGQALAAAPKVRFPVPMLPWWGGAGPNLWRQLTSASRAPAQVVVLLLLFLMPVLVFLFVARNDPTGSYVAGPAVSVLVGLALFSPSVVGYDFHPDLGRMEDLKTLPIRPTRLVLGQLATPVLLLTAAEWLAFGLIAGFAPRDARLLLAAAALAIPVNLVLVAVENLYFLWFPFRTAGINSFDFQSMGRQLLLLMAKGVSIGVAAGLAVGAGALLFYLTGRSWTAAVVAAWSVVAGCGLGLIPLVAVAFEQFDVSGDLPD